MGKKSVKELLTDNFVMYIIIVFILTFLGQIVGALIAFPLDVIGRAKGGDYSDIWSIAIQYFSTIGCWILFLLWFLFKKNRYMYGELTTKQKGNNILLFVIGLVIGFGMNFICAMVALVHGDIKLQFDSFNPIGLLIVAICVLIQSSSEELACRVYLYQKLLKRYKHPAVAVVGNAVLFGFMHILNPGISVLAVINITLIGIFFSLFVYYFNSFWCASAIHAAWNFTQNIILGLPNSGMVSPFSWFRLTDARDSFAYNVEFGVESTLVAMFVEIIGIAVVVLIGRKYKKNAKKDESAS